ncbi:MAG: protein phosphatase 2C domain-containing protein, partial [Trichodesmium sp. MAG_R01]|nr:protein phosphatase 2C domain-containing protein [Trichodesmium sp. MAG_R01]
MSKEQVLVISLENKLGQGEDFQIAEDYEQAIVIGVFDGLGGRILGTAKETGGRIASRKVAEITKDILAESQGNLDQDRASEIKGKSCQILKEFAEKNLPTSRIRGKLASKRLCSTIGVASLFKRLTDEQKYLVQIAWMGDSRIYYLHPHQGLQQLTKDDFKENKNALEVIYQDLPMSKFLTADPEADWEINYKEFEFSEEGFVFACTDGCFQYLPAPWEFEKLLLKTLIESNSMEEWQNLLTNFYKYNKYDDVTLLLYPLGKNELNFQYFHSAYQSRLEHLNKNYNIHSKSNPDELKEMWEQYQNDYENRLEKVKVKDSLDAEKVKTNDLYLSNLDEETEADDTTEEISAAALTEEKTEADDTTEEISAAALTEEKTEADDTTEEISAAALTEEKTEAD